MSSESSRRVEVSNVPYLDLTGCTTPEEITRIGEICNVGAVLVPEALMGAFASVEVTNVGTIVPVAEGVRMTVHAGSVRLSGEALANPDGSPSDLMVLVGAVVLTSAPTRVGYQLVVVGSLLAPEEAQSTIAAAVRHTAGIVTYYRGKNVRIFTEGTLDNEYFDLLPEPIALVVMGSVTLESDVTKEMLRQKVTSIALMGEMTVPRHVRSLVQALITDQQGELKVLPARDR